MMDVGGITMNVQKFLQLMTNPRATVLILAITFLGGILIGVCACTFDKVNTQWNNKNFLIKVEKIENCNNKTINIIKLIKNLMVNIRQI